MTAFCAQKTHMLANRMQVKQHGRILTLMRTSYIDDNSSMPDIDETAISATRKWLERAVIGLNLCPFAKAVVVRQQIRWVVSHAESEAVLLDELRRELLLLARADVRQIETTLLIHPAVLTDFLQYNGFLPRAERTLRQEGLEGVLQIASFHPDYCFSGSEPKDVSNNSNRSPYPMLHLLREKSIERAVRALPDSAQIYQRNIDTLNELGPEGWNNLWID